MFSAPLSASLAGASVGLGWRTLVAHRASEDIWPLIAALPVGVGFACTRGPRLQRSLFLMGSSLNGWLTLIALIRLETDSGTGIFVNLFLTMVLVGLALPHIVAVECTLHKQEMFSFGVVALFATEAVLSSRFALLKCMLSLALGSVGVAGLLQNREWAWPAKWNWPSKNRVEQVTPFVPGTFVHLRQYAPRFLLGVKASTIGEKRSTRKDDRKGCLRLLPREELDLKKLVERRISEKKEIVVDDLPEIQKHLKTLARAEVGTDIRWHVVLKEMARIDAERKAEHTQEAQESDIESVLVADLLTADDPHVVQLEDLTQVHAAATPLRSWSAGPFQKTWVQHLKSDHVRFSEPHLKSDHGHFSEPYGKAWAQHLKDWQGYAWLNRNTAASGAHKPTAGSDLRADAVEFKPANVEFHRTSIEFHPTVEFHPTDDSAQDDHYSTEEFHPTDVGKQNRSQMSAGVASVPSYPASPGPSNFPASPPGVSYPASGRAAFHNGWEDVKHANVWAKHSVDWMPTSQSFSPDHHNTLNSHREGLEPFDAKKRVWAYRDPKGRTHRTFSSTEMFLWFEAGFFHDGLQVAFVPRKDSYIDWASLQELFPHSAPFSSWPVTLDLSAGQQR